MRIALGVAVFSLFTAGCLFDSDEDKKTDAPQSLPDTTKPPPPGSVVTQPTAPDSKGAVITPQGTTACVAPTAVKLADAADDGAIQLVDGRVYFAKDGALQQVAVSGADAKELLEGGGIGTSQNPRYWVANAQLLTLTAGGGCSSTVVRPLTDGALGEVTMGMGMCSAASPVFTEGGEQPTPAPIAFDLRIRGNDDNGFFTAETTKWGTSIARYEGATLHTTFSMWDEKAIDSPVDVAIAGGHVFWVSEKKNIESADTSVSPGVAKHVATVDGCHLAVSGTTAYCSTASVISSFPADGSAAPSTLLALANSTSTSAFGAVVSDNGTLFVASDATTPAGQNVLRQVKADGTESMLACGRDTIAGVAYDAAHVVFIEHGKGVFAIAR